MELTFHMAQSAEMSHMGKAAELLRYPYPLHCCQLMSLIKRPRPSPLLSTRYLNKLVFMMAFVHK